MIRRLVRAILPLSIAAAPLIAGASPAAAASSVTPEIPSFNLGEQRVGHASSTFLVRLINNGSAPAQIEGWTDTGDAADFPMGGGTCTSAGGTIPPQQDCYYEMRFEPKAIGDRADVRHISTDTGSLDVSFRGTGLDGAGYWMVTADGRVFAFGAAVDGDAQVGTVKAVDIEQQPGSTSNIWVVDELGQVYAGGGRGYAPLGPPPILQAGERITSMSATGSGRTGDLGYWLFSNKGRVFAYGSAPFVGDLTGMSLNGPVLDSVPTPSGKGYYMVASDGGVFTFGDAVFDGSMGAAHLNAPVQSLVPDPDGLGYWLVASDGGIFAFDAGFYGSMGGVRLNRPVTGMVGSRSGNGYLMVGEDGGIFTFGDVEFRGSLGDNPPASPVTAVAAYR